MRLFLSNKTIFYIFIFVLTTVIERSTSFENGEADPRQLFRSRRLQYREKGLFRDLWSRIRDFLQRISNKSPDIKPTKSPTYMSVPSLPPSKPPTRAPANCPKYIETTTPFPGGGKKGIGFVVNDNTYVNVVPKIVALDSYWHYGWILNRSEFLPDSPVFVPMSWGGGRNRADFENRVINGSNVRSLIQQGIVTHLLGFNEPDSAKQSNMNVSTAIDRWSVLESLNVPLVSPSCVSPKGSWMTAFMDEVDKRCLRVNYVGVHWYGSPSINLFKSELTKVYDLYKRPIVLTEFAVADWNASKTQNITDNRYSPEIVLNFMKEALPYLEATDYIAGYAWFPFQITSPHGYSSALFDLNDNLTTLGKFYKSVRADNMLGDQSLT